MRSFSAGRQGCRPLQESFIFSVGANCVRPPLFTICVRFLRDAEDVVPYESHKILAVGACTSAKICSFFCGMPRTSSPTKDFKLFRRGDSRIARFCARYAFVFGGTPRMSSPTRKFYLLRRGELCSPAFVHDMRSFFAGRRGRRPLQGHLNSALCILHSALYSLCTLHFITLLCTSPNTFVQMCSKKSRFP